jgi:hypothetical protein
MNSELAWHLVEAHRDSFLDASATMVWVNLGAGGLWP